MFGTFQQELDNEPPVYGITRPSRTYNPITINVEHWTLLIKDAWRAQRWTDKLTIWFRPTGWRPEGFDEKYPVSKITTPYNFEKYKPQIPTGLFIWSNIQFFVLAFFVLYALKNISVIGMNGVICLAVFVFVQVFSATELMNRSKLAAVYSSVSTIVCFGIYLFDNSWFGTDEVWSILPLAFMIYFVLQTALAFKFTTERESVF